MNGDFDGIVVGAGVAGLAAARMLAESGQRILVIDARDRTGGRILTQAVGNRAVELGAEFVHGAPPELCQLLEEARLQTRELDGARYWWQDGHLAGCENELSKSLLWLERLKTVKKDNWSFAEFMSEASVPEELRPRLTDYVEGFNAADSAVIGAASLGQQQAAEDAIDGDRLFHVQGGYAQLPRFLETKLIEAQGRLLLNTRVMAVRWMRGRVEIDCLQLGQPVTFRAGFAIITLPLGVLQSGSVRFQPEPAAIAQAAAQLRMGHVWRAVMLFRDRFWARLKDRSNGATLDQLSFLFSSQTNPSTWWTPLPDKTAMLTAWAGGPRAQILARLAPDESKRHLIETASRIFDVSSDLIQDQLIQVAFHDWERDPFSLGAYSYVPAGALEASKCLAHPVGDTLFFAGEHTDITGHWGTVHGALRSGLRAAKQVAALAAR